MSGTINNGRRAEVAFGSYTGEAGVVVQNGVTTVSFPGVARRFEPGMIGSIGDAPHRIASAESSRLVEGMVVLTVAAVTSDEPE